MALAQELQRETARFHTIAAATAQAISEVVDHPTLRHPHGVVDKDRAMVWGIDKSHLFPIGVGRVIIVDNGVRVIRKDQSSLEPPRRQVGGSFGWVSFNGENQQIFGITDILPEPRYTDIPSAVVRVNFTAIKDSKEGTDVASLEKTSVLWVPDEPPLMRGIRSLADLSRGDPEAALLAIRKLEPYCLGATNLLKQYKDHNLPVNSPIKRLLAVIGIR